MYAEIQENLRTQIHTLEASISTTTDALLKVDYLVEKTDLEFDLEEVTTAFYEPWKAKTDNLIALNEFLAPTDAEYLWFTAEFELLYNASSLEALKDASSILNITATEMRIYKENLIAYENYV